VSGLESPLVGTLVQEFLRVVAIEAALSVEWVEPELSKEDEKGWCVLEGAAMGRFGRSMGAAPAVAYSSVARAGASGGWP